MLLRHPRDHTRIIQIRPILWRFGSDDIEVLDDFDFVSANSQIYKSRPKKCDAWDLSIVRVLRRNLGDDTICCYNVENVDVFDDGGCERDMPVTLRTFVSRDLRIAGTVRKHSEHLKRRRRLILIGAV